MSDGKGIERFTPAHSTRMDACPDGLYVRTEDHLDALGEAEKEKQEAWDLCNEECQRSGYHEERAEHAEKRLEELREGLQSEIGILRQRERSCDHLLRDPGPGSLTTHVLEVRRKDAGSVASYLEALLNPGEESSS